MQSSTGQLSNSIFYCAHNGQSMNPTLCKLDCLEVVPYGGRKIRIGDVVLFQPPKWNHLIVHRVVRMTQAGIWTRGDNNTIVDPWTLQPEEIVGKVIYARHGKGRRIVIGGLAGFVVAAIRCLKRPFESKVSLFLQPIYHLILRCGVPKGFFISKP